LLVSMEVDAPKMSALNAMNFFCFRCPGRLIVFMAAALECATLHQGRPAPSGMPSTGPCCRIGQHIDRCRKSRPSTAAADDARFPRGSTDCSAADDR
jgi:hypothetical protein